MPSAPKTSTTTIEFIANRKRTNSEGNPVAVFLNSLRNACLFAATDLSRPVLTMVKFELEIDEPPVLKLLATDSFAMVEIPLIGFEVKGSEGQWLIPAEILRYLLTIAKTSQLGSLSLAFKGDTVSFNLKRLIGFQTSILDFSVELTQRSSSFPSTQVFMDEAKTIVNSRKADIGFQLNMLDRLGKVRARPGALSGSSYVSSWMMGTLKPSTWKIAESDMTIIQMPAKTPHTN